MTADPINYLKRCGRERAAVVAALALLEEMSPGGVEPLDVRDAYALVTGFVDLVGWTSMDPSIQSQIAQLLGLRAARLANPTAFRSRAEEVLADRKAPYGAGIADTFVRATEMDAAAIAAAAIAALADRSSRSADDSESADPGPARLRAHARGGGDVFTYTIPAGELRAPSGPVFEVVTQPATGPLNFTFDELLETARRIADAERSLGHLPRALEALSSRLFTVDRESPTGLVLAPGPLDLLVAPTGVGKSVLVTVLSVHAALQGLRIAIAVPDIAATRKLAHDLDLAANAVGLPGAVAAALTPDRVWEVVSRGLDQLASDDPDGSWGMTQFGYTCWLSAFEDERRWRPGREPCRGQLRRDGEDGTVDCPFLNECERTSGQRRALEAPISVVNHHALLAGTFHGSVQVDGEERSRVTMLEVLLRGSHVVLVDEIDRLQVAGFGLAARQFDLADRGVIDTPLSRLERDLAGLVPPAPGRLPDEDRFRTVVRSTAWLADRYLALHEHGAPLGLAADGELHYALAQDQRLAVRLLLLDDNVDASSEDAAAVVAFAADLLDDLCDGRVVDDGRRKELAANNQLDLDAATAALRPAAADNEGFDRVRSLTEALVVPRANGGDPDVVLAELADELERWLPTGSNVVATAHELAHRAFRVHLNQWLRQLTLQLPGMERGGIVSAGSLAEQLARPAGPQIIPLGPLGGLRFGFRVDAHPRPKLSAQMATGDPHRTVANLGDVISLALAGTKRAVVGLSATAWLPGAPRSHVHGRLRWIVPDDQSEALALVELPVVAPDARPVRISGILPGSRLDRLEVLGRGLWEQHLKWQLDALLASGEGRHKVLIVTANYADTDALALGIAAAIGPDAFGRVVRLVSRDRDAQPLGLTITTTIDRLPDFVSDPDAAILVAPLGAVARGHNIVGADGRAALGAIYVCVRPLPPDRDPEIMLARVNAHASRIVEQRRDLRPGEAVAELQSKAFSRLRQLIAMSGPFSRQPLDMRLEVIIEMLADLIQLAGRARRGGTTATMYLVDAAFHEPGAARNASLASHIGELVNGWQSTGHLADLLWIYEATLGAFARLPHATKEATV